MYRIATTVNKLTLSSRATIKRFQEFTEVYYFGCEDFKILKEDLGFERTTSEILRFKKISRDSTDLIEIQRFIKI